MRGPTAGSRVVGVQTDTAKRPSGKEHGNRLMDARLLGGRGLERGMGHAWHCACVALTRFVRRVGESVRVHESDSVGVDRVPAAGTA